MITKRFYVDPRCTDKTELIQAAEILSAGGLVAFPTETVYGLGANGLEKIAVDKIFKAKGRPADNPIILHIASQADVMYLAQRVPSNAWALMEQFWPGPLTIVLERKPIVPDIVTGGLNTVAIRMPCSEIALELIKLSGVPIAAPSANLSGRPSPTNIEAVLADLDGKIDAAVDGGATVIGLESTVIDCTTPVPTLLRPGGITLEMLQDVLGTIEIDRSIKNNISIPRSPGMKYAHYIPAAPMVLIEGEISAVSSLLVAEINESIKNNKKVGAIVANETAKLIHTDVEIFSYGHQKDLSCIATNIYKALRHFDTHKVDIIFAEGVEETGIGLAVMNRLRKAAGYSILMAN